MKTTNSYFQSHVPTNRSSGNTSTERTKSVKDIIVETGNTLRLPTSTKTKFCGMKKRVIKAIRRMTNTKVKQDPFDEIHSGIDIDTLRRQSTEVSSALKELDPVTAEQQLINDVVKMYTESVVEKYQGNKEIKLKNDISSISELCVQLNDKVNKVDNENKSTFLPLFIAFTKEIAGRTINYLGRMSGFPYHLYLQENTKQVEEAKQMSENKRLLADCLKGYINNDRHLKCFKDTLKKEEIKKYAVIELKDETNVVFRIFPKNNREICKLLNILSQHHRADKTWAKDLAKFLQKSELAAFMKIKPLENNGQLQLVFLEDGLSLTSVNDNIEKLTLLTQFVGNKVSYSINVLTHFNKPNNDADKLQNAQQVYYRMTQAFANGMTKDYLKESGLGNKNNTIQYTVKTRNSIDKALEDIEQASNSKFSFKKDKYGKVKTRLENIRAIADNWETLKYNIASNNTVESIDNTLRDAIVEDIKQLDRELTSINLNKFTQKIKQVSIGIGVATVASLFLTPYLAISLFITGTAFGLIYLIAKYKPETVPSDINEILSKNIKELSNKKTDAKFKSQAVPWAAAFKFWLTGILPAVVVKKRNDETTSPITEKLSTFHEEYNNHSKAYI
ncbi:hypothetical protein [Candidatus Fukatsuia endosymbiont of Tuberolachnus salignus]|uniref:hypothetical protein n=1 Tax=Candidatus Fukatsuia endosymbiont of Tuberolachnus salignus TaxID=3077957 RepID=UPI00313BAB76